MKRKRVYIAGPMRGYPSCNYPAFRAAAQHLRETHPDWAVESPAEIGERFGGQRQLLDNPELLRRVMDFELRVVVNCDAVYLLKGWERSEGARAELMVALDRRKEIMLEARNDNQT